MCRIVVAERVPVWPGSRAAEYPRGSGERTQIGRRGSSRTQAPVGRQYAGGGASCYVADAAHRFFLNGARFPARLAGGYRFRERSSADDQFRSAPDSVQHNADAAVLQAVGRTHAANSGRTERGPDAEHTTWN